MKKTISLFLFLIILSSFTFAVQHTTTAEVSLNIEDKKPEVTGLNLAITKVTSEVAKAKLQINIDKIYNVSSDVELKEENGKSIIVAKKKAKFLGLFPVDVTNTFDINEDGSVVRRTKFVDILFTEEDVEVN